MIRVSPRARRRHDRSGDPLDGLVNMFDIGIVLAVGFLLAALSSLHASGVTTKKGVAALAPTPTPSAPQITLRPGQKTATVPSPSATAIGEGQRVGTVYRLTDGTLIWVDTGTSAPPPKAGK